MLPPILETLTRLLGIFTSISLALSPWVIAVDSEDIFLNQSWIIFGLGTISACFLCVMLLFFRPRAKQLPYILPAIFLWTAIVVSTIFSPFLASLRSAILLGTQLFLLIFLRISRQRRDTARICNLISFSGAMMAIYAVIQWFGYDLFEWTFGSHYTSVGTFSNPNFLGAYLTATALLTFGFVREGLSAPGLPKALRLLAFILQVAAIILTNSTGAIFCLLIGLVMFFTESWGIRSKGYYSKHRIAAAVTLALAITAIFGSFHISANSFNWEDLPGIPRCYLAVTSRLTIWQMGFRAFLCHPLIGMGPGGMKYLLTSFQPPWGISLGLSTFNDDPHSMPLLALGETGILGFTGFCFLAVVFLAIHTRSKSHYDWNSEVSSDSGALSPPDYSRSIAISAFSLVLNSLFNTTLSILPLANCLLLLVSVHESACLRDLKWRKSRSFLNLTYLIFPFLLGGFSWALQANYSYVSMALFRAEKQLHDEQFTQAEESYRQIIQADPQSLHGLWGLATALEAQGKLAQTQELLARIDHLGPNAFAVRYHLARVLLERKMVLEAHRYALKGLAVNRFPPAYELLGRILLAEGRIDEAEQVFREGLTFAPLIEKSWDIETLDRIKIHLASISSKKESYEEVRHYLSTLSSVGKRLPEAYFLYGLIFYNDKKHEEALDNFEKALELDNSNPHYMNAVGFLLVHFESDLERAKELLEASYQILRSRNPLLLSDVLRVAHSLGMLYWKTGELEKAHELLSLAYRQCPSEWKAIKAERKADLARFCEMTGNKMPPEDETN